jgi:hypothetical protein
MCLHRITVSEDSIDDNQQIKQYRNVTHIIPTNVAYVKHWMLVFSTPLLPRKFYCIRIL